MYITKQILLLSALSLAANIVSAAEQTQPTQERQVKIGNLTGKRYSVTIAPEGNTYDEIAEAYRKVAGLSNRGDWVKIIIADQGKSWYCEDGRKYSFEELSKVTLHAMQNRYPESAQ